MPTWLFIAQNKRFLAFGLACTLASNFGQTFFIALFSDHIRGEFQLSHGDFGALYSIATVCSAAIILWAGRQIDRVDLRLFAGVVFAGLSLSCAALALAPGLIWLCAALVGLRLFGQGLLRHTAVVSMARYFEATRGRAMSIVGLGYPIAEATFPALLIVVLAAMTWREAWGWAAAYIALAHLPMALWLLKGHGVRHAKLEEKLAQDDSDNTELTQRAILKDWRFQTIAPAALMGPFMMTGLFFHQLALAEAKGWEVSLIAASFPAFAATTVISSLTCGWLVDRFGPGRVLPGFVWPLAGALLVVASTKATISVPLYMMLGGLTVGASTVLISSAWADTFGVKHLGAIRALTSALTVLSTAIAPLWAGWLLDGGWAVENIALGAAAIIVATGVLVQFPAKNLREIHSAKFL